MRWATTSRSVTSTGSRSSTSSGTTSTPCLVRYHVRWRPTKPRAPVTTAFPGALDLERFVLDRLDEAAEVFEPVRAQATDEEHRHHHRGGQAAREVAELDPEEEVGDGGRAAERHDADAEHEPDGPRDQ